MPEAEGNRMEVQIGDHSEEKNEKLVKKQFAKQYALQATAGQALLLMEKAGIPEEHRPTTAQLNNFRPKQHDLYRAVSTPTLEILCRKNGRGQFKGRYEAYCQQMAEDGTWGDELTLLGAAHLLRRPILLVTDSSDNKAYCREINPPNIIAKSLWGPALKLACFLDRHFDATEPLP